jgi:HD-like signal output (HDOD) protein
MNALQRLSEIQELPTLPEMALKIRTLIYSDESDATILARLIEQDPALAAKILKVANSSFYCQGNKINSIKLAVTRIGFNEVGHIALAISMIKKFSRNSDLLNYKQFWRHSLAAGYLCAMSGHSGGQELSSIDSHLLFLSGLFHDIGILIYDQYFHAEFEEVMKYACDKEISFIEAEKELCNSDNHAIFGSALLELWKIDLQIVSGVRYHHQPEKAPQNFSLISSATYLAEYILCNSGLGHFEGSIPNGNKQAMEMLHITPEMASRFMNLADYEVERSDLVTALESEVSYSSQLRSI